MVYKIERKEVLINIGTKFQRKYPLDRMVSGDTFDFPISEILKVRNAVWHYRRKSAVQVVFKVFRVTHEQGRCACMSRLVENPVAMIPLTTGEKPITEIETAILQQIVASHKHGEFHGVAGAELKRRGVGARTWRAEDGTEYEVDLEGCIFNADGNEVDDDGEVVEEVDASIMAQRAARKAGI